MRKYNNIYCADFETTTDVEDCRVWAYALHKIINSEKIVHIGNSIEDFFAELKKKNSSIIIYFHNLKFDGNFIISYLLKNGYIYTDKREKEEKTFSCLIDGRNTFFNIKVNLRNTRGNIITIEFRDSYKKLPMSIKEMPEAFGLSINKLELDDGYKGKRKKGHKLTENEKRYITNDVIILSKSILILYENGMKALTLPSDAMKTFKKMIGRNTFKNLFPPLEIEVDNSIRKSYRGGWCYNLKEQQIGAGLAFDANSLYSAVMYSELDGREHLYPYGEPEYYVGEYKQDKYKPLYIQHIKASFKLKEGKLPTLQYNKSFTFGKTKFIEETEEILDLYLTCIDLDMFLEHYHMYYIEYIDGYKFQGIKGLFDEYVSKFMKVKIENNNNNPSMRTIAKLYLVALYGKFGTSRKVINKKPILENNVVKYVPKVTINEYGIEDEYSLIEGYRVDVASFCTAYAREVTIKTAQQLHEQGRFCYSDTDSLHISGTEIPTNIKISETELGHWKLENTFEKAIFLRSKTYAEYINGKWEITCAGMTEEVKEYISEHIELFKYGFNSADYGLVGKLTPKLVEGGVVLKEQSFSLKNN